MGQIGIGIDSDEAPSACSRYPGGVEASAVFARLLSPTGATHRHMPAQRIIAGYHSCTEPNLIHGRDPIVSSYCFTAPCAAAPPPLDPRSGNTSLQYLPS